MPRGSRRHPPVYFKLALGCGSRNEAPRERTAETAASGVSSPEPAGTAFCYTRGMTRTTMGCRTLAVIALGSLGGSLAACSSRTGSLDSLPTAAIERCALFPTDRGLNRAEDGVALPDGRLIVSDQAFGLRIISTDGSSGPFGGMQAAGYLHDPPKNHAAANGVSLEPDGEHILVADVLGGGIYRVAITNGATERVNQHRFGVNTACRDSTGAIWFTQSTECTAESGEARMFAAADIPIADGSLWRLDFRDGRFGASATVVLDGLYFANGLALDERAKAIYVAETCGDRVLTAPLDVAAGRIGKPSVLATLATPDNLELDARGRLWVTSPILNEVGVLDTRTGEYRVVFRQQSSAQADRAAEFVRRGKESIPRIALFAPEQWEPLPGPITGVILGPGEHDRHISGLSPALIRLPR